MIRLRQEQISALASVPDGQFQQQLADLLRANFPDASDLPPSELEQAIGEELVKARSYGFTNQRQCATYVLCAWMLGRQFDTEFPAACDTLRATDMSPDDRSDWLMDWLLEMFQVLAGGETAP